MMLPELTLSTYYKKVERGEIKPEVLPFEVTIRFAALSRAIDTPIYLETLLKDFKGQYYLEKDDASNKWMALHFWEASHAEAASKKLSKS